MFKDRDPEIQEAIDKSIEREEEKKTPKEFKIQRGHFGWMILKRYKTIKIRLFRKDILTYDYVPVDIHGKLVSSYITINNLPHTPFKTYFEALEHLAQIINNKNIIDEREFYFDEKDLIKESIEYEIYHHGILGSLKPGWYKADVGILEKDGFNIDELINKRVLRIKK